jgi:hypothetical protein
MMGLGKRMGKVKQSQHFLRGEIRNHLYRLDAAMAMHVFVWSDRTRLFRRQD